MLLVDFDETLTEEDTTPIILEAAIRAAGKTRGAQGAADLRAKRGSLVEQYALEREALMSRVLVKAPEGSGQGAPWVEGFCRILSTFDRDANQRVVDAGVLAGIAPGALTKAGCRVRMQAGALRVLRRAVAQRIPTRIVSANWSATLVRAALRSVQGGVPVAPSDMEQSAARQVANGAVQVFANELEYMAGVSTGGMIRRVECADDKLALIQRLMPWTSSAPGPESGPGEGLLRPNGVQAKKPCRAGGLSVYIGDAAADLSAMLAADVGIVVGRGALLRRVIEVAGIALQPLPPELPERASRRDVLYEAPGWEAIEACLLGPPGCDGESCQVPRVLAIAGSDPSGGAGAQADLKTLAAAGVFGAAALTALTVQDTCGVHSVEPVSAPLVAAQVAAVLGDLGADVVKTGMLPTAEVVDVVAHALVQFAVPALVVDPVLVSTSGHALTRDEAMRALVTRLLPLATVVTPNLAEARALLGDSRDIKGVDDMAAAARELHALGPRYVLVKGGHLPLGACTDPATGADLACDVLFDGDNIQVLTSPRVATGNTHGTGCTTASALAAALALGESVPAAVRFAKAYVAAALAASARLRLGAGPHGPLHHGFGVADWAARAAAPGLDLRLYVVTDPACNAHWGRTTLDAAAAALGGGATALQVRQKGADDSAFVEEARAVVALAHAAGVSVIINDRVDVALAADADGAHIGQSDLPAAAARTLLGPGRVLGVSVKSVAQAQAAAAAGADYLGAGAVFPTATKDSATISLGELAAICAVVDIPVVAIGGITAANAAHALDAGCAGVAVVSAVFGQEDVAAAAAGLRQVVNQTFQNIDGLRWGPHILGPKDLSVT